MRVTTILGSLVLSVSLCSSGFSGEILNRVLGLDCGGCGQCGPCASACKTCEPACKTCEPACNACPSARPCCPIWARLCCTPKVTRCEKTACCEKAGCATGCNTGCETGCAPACKPRWTPVRNVLSDIRDAFCCKPGCEASCGDVGCGDTGCGGCGSVSTNGAAPSKAATKAAPTPAPLPAPPKAPAASPVPPAPVTK